MTLNFSAETKYQDFIDIENIGNFSLIGYTEDLDEYVVIVDTWEGQTRILSAGPFTPDMEKLPPRVMFEFQQIKFNEKKIKSVVQKYIRFLIQVQEVNKEEALEELKDLKEYMKNSIY